MYFTKIADMPKKHNYLYTLKSTDMLEVFVFFKLSFFKNIQI